MFIILTTIVIQVRQFNNQKEFNNMTILNKSEIDDIWIGSSYGTDPSEVQEGKTLSIYISRASNGQVHLKDTAENLEYILNSELGELSPDMAFEVTIKRAK